MISLEPFDQIENLLSLLDFVAWDRFTQENIGGIAYYSFYGWITREKDSYKDFLLLTLKHSAKYGFEWGFITSSAKYTKKIALLVMGKKQAHIPCRRIEKYFKIPNSIKLKTK